MSQINTGITPKVDPRVFLGQREDFGFANQGPVLEAIGALGKRREQADINTLAALVSKLGRVQYSHDIARAVATAITSGTDPHSIGVVGNLLASPYVNNIQKVKLVESIVVARPDGSVDLKHRDSLLKLANKTEDLYVANATLSALAQFKDGTVLPVLKRIYDLAMNQKIDPNATGATSCQDSICRKVVKIWGTQLKTNSSADAATALVGIVTDETSMSHVRIYALRQLGACNHTKYFDNLNKFASRKGMLSKSGEEQDPLKAGAQRLIAERTKLGFIHAEEPKEAASK